MLILLQYLPSGNAAIFYQTAEIVLDICIIDVKQHKL